MTLTKTLKNAWRYLNTSHGTHSVSRLEYGHDGHSFTDTFVWVDEENKTPLQQIAITAALLGVLTGIGFGVRSCVQHRAKINESAARVILDPNGLESQLRYREITKNSIEYSKKIWSSEDERQIEYLEGELRTYNKTLEDIKEDIEGYRERIKMQIEKGYLTPENPEYKGFEKYFGNEAWWPKTKQGN